MNLKYNVCHVPIPQIHNSPSFFDNFQLLVAFFFLLLISIPFSPFCLQLPCQNPSCLSPSLLHHPSPITLPLLHRSSRTGFCDSGLPPTLLPQHHLRSHWQRRHLRPGGGATCPGAPSPEEAECPAAPRSEGELSAPPSPSATSAVTSGHLGPGPRPPRRSGLPHCSWAVPLHSSGSAAAVGDSLSLGTFLHGLTSIILSGCSGCEVRGIISLFQVRNIFLDPTRDRTKV